MQDLEEKLGALRLKRAEDKAKLRAGEAQDPAGAGAGMGTQNAGAAGRPAAAPPGGSRGTQGGPTGKGPLHGGEG